MDDPVTDLIVIAVKDLYLHLWIMLFEEMDHSRHPQCCNTGKASYPQLSFDLMINIKGRLAQLCLLVYHFLDIRDQSGSVVCKYDPLFYSGK